MFKNAVKLLIIGCITLLLTGCLSLLSFGTETSNPQATAGTAKDEFEESVKILAQRLQPLTYNGKGKPAVAIMLFASDKKNTALESYVQEVLHEQFFKQGNTKLIDRGNFDAILAEQNFHLSGYVDDASAKGIGHLIGADFLCFGTIIDMGEIVRVSAKLANVLTGEIVAMSSINASKNNYINSLTGSLGSGGTSSDALRQKSRNLWQVTQSRNEFDGYTTCTFILPCSGSEYLFVGYDKWDVPARSVVRAGINWGKYDYLSAGTYEIKGDNGQIVSKRFEYAYWSKITGWKKNESRFSFSYNNKESARYMLELFLNNNTVTLRKENMVRRFETAGLSAKMSEIDVSWHELNAALRNEEF